MEREHYDAIRTSIHVMLSLLEQRRLFHFTRTLMSCAIALAFFFECQSADDDIEAFGRACAPAVMPNQLSEQSQIFAGKQLLTTRAATKKKRRGAIIK